MVIVMLEGPPEEQVITVNIFPAFGPQNNPIRLMVSRSDTLGSIRRTLSSLFKIGIHSRVILTSCGEELGLNDDKMTLQSLGIRDGDSLTLILYTHPIPLKSASFYRSKDTEIRSEALEKCMEHAKRHSHVEVGGVLVGRETAEEKILVVDSLPISEGSLGSVILDPVRIANIAEELRRNENYLVGWYHSHLKSRLSMSSIDARLHSGYQQLYPKTIALILDPVREVAELYSMKGVPYLQAWERVRLNILEPRPVTMDSDTLTLTTIIEKREEAEITAFSGSDTTTGEQATFTVTVKNTGTVIFSNVKINLSIFSPDRRESFLICSDEVVLSPGDSETYTLRCEIPASWPSGDSLVTVGVRNMATCKWLCPLTKASIKLLQSPVYSVKISAYRTSQKINPGQTATYLVMVKNCGNRRDNIEITWDKSQVPESWELRIYDGGIEREPPFSITLDANATRRLVLKVTSPLTGYGGEQVPITLMGRSLSALASEKAEERISS